MKVMELTRCLLWRTTALQSPIRVSVFIEYSSTSSSRCLVKTWPNFIARSIQALELVETGSTNKAALMVMLPRLRRSAMKPST